MDFQTVITYIFGFLVIAIPLLAIYKCILNNDHTKGERILWMAGVLIIPVFGGVIYLIMHGWKK